MKKLEGVKTKTLEDIIKGCINNNIKDQEVFFKLFSRKLMVVAQRVGPNDNVANDILQDGFIKIFRNIKSLKFYDEGHVLAWCKTIITNQAIDFYRKEKKYSAEFSHQFEESGQYFVGREDNTLESEDTTYLDSKNIPPTKIIKAIQNLPPSYKLVFNMFVIDGLSHEEISQKLNICEGTSKSNLFKAREKLRKDLTLCN